MHTNARRPVEVGVRSPSDSDGKGVGFWVVWLLMTTPIVLLGGWCLGLGLQGFGVGVLGALVCGTSLLIMARVATAPNPGE